MDTLMLSRIQFGISIGFHYIYPIATLGFGLFIVIFESLYLFKKNDQDRKIASFLINLLALTFSLGVATGIMMPFVIGANWSRFSAFAGGIFGMHLVIESVTAFALESVFLAILVFGRKRVSQKLYWFSAVMVFIGSHMSAFWIVSANSWMQSPAGYALENGRLVLTSLTAAIFNPTAPVRFIHVVSATWLAGAVIVCGIAALYLLKGINTDYAKRMIKIALVPFVLCSLLQAGIGHIHIMQVKAHQPAKNAAYEGIFTDTRGATLYMFGIPDQKNRKIRFGVGMPYGLSFLETGRFDSLVEGLDRFPESEWPPVNVIFTTFHLMVMMGVILIVTSLVASLLYLKQRLFTSRLILKILVYMIPIPFLASEIGWIGTEIGRQPWTIYGLLRTADASSTVIPASSFVVSILVTLTIYISLLVIYIIAMKKMVNSSFKEGE